MNPYDPAELGRHDPELDRVAHELERQVAEMGGEPPLDLSRRIMAAIDEEPIPASRWAWLGGFGGPARLLATAAVILIAVVGALAIGSLVEQARPDVGGPSSPSAVPSLSASPTSSPTASPSPTPTASPSPTATPSPSATPTLEPTVRPTPSDDDEIETPEPSESDDDNSGPGGGGDDNSGPGGGDG
jgi:hypothetical protein